MEPTLVVRRLGGMSSTTVHQTPVTAEGANSTNAMSDTTVINAATDFDTFYREHRATIGKALAFTLGDSALGFEATDEAMARAFQRWDQVQRYANPAGWVYRTGLNWARSILRRRKRARPKDRLVAGPASSVDLHADTDLKKALGKLNDKHRAVVVLRFYWDLSVEETAAALGIRPGTVKSRLARALETLGSRLDHEGSEQ